jgi:hypothetical protein
MRASSARLPRLYVRIALDGRRIVAVLSVSVKTLAPFRIGVDFVQ